MLLGNIVKCDRMVSAYTALATTLVTIPKEVLPVTESTWPTSSDDKLRPPYLSLSAHKENTWC